MISFKRVKILLFILLLMNVLHSQKKMKWLVEPQYANITYNTHAKVFITRGLYNGSFREGILDSNCNLLLDCIADRIFISIENNSVLYNKGGGMGTYATIKSGIFVQNKHIENIIPSFIQGFDEGLAIVQDSLRKYGYIRINGELAIPCKYDYANPYLNGFAVVNDDKLGIGIIDKSGKAVLPLKYRLVKSIFRNFYQLGHDQLYNANLNQLLQVEDMEPDYARNGMIAVKKGKWGIVNSELQTIVPYIYDFASIQDSNWIKVKTNNKIGLYSSKGKLVIEPLYDEISTLEFYDSLHVVKKDTKYCILDKKGKIVINENLDDIRSSLRVAYKDNRKGIIDYKNKKVIWTEYEKLESLNDSYLIFSNNIKYGLVDNKNKTVLDCQYDRIALSSRNKYIIAYKGVDEFYYDSDMKLLGKNLFTLSPNRYPGYVQDKGKWGYLSENGNLVVPCNYEEQVDITHNLLLIDGLQYVVMKSKSKYGIIDFKNNLIIPFEYDEIRLVDKKRFILKKDDKFGIGVFE
jgi:WG containing repeat